ncbi:hypothetical protein NHX12_001396 [Muraenolepis orangiensis]|uniref:C2H2-type domain-containing protein n=1 Tax=Muraenolepis orangiensis TaxID=630683 RepID=A0A9Q0IH61_9TELE|nr:hypothetical protein NHX12_001396 [Muraenolepis orangiensis]
MQSQALAHYKGTKHAKKLKAHGAPKSRLKGSALAKQETAKGINSPDEAHRKGIVSPGILSYLVSRETEEEKAKRLLYCSLCKVAVNSASQLDAHNSGTKHKTMLEARTGGGSIKSYPRTGVKGKIAAAAPPPKSATGLQNKTFHCETCDVHVNSETQLKQHISSRRHKDRAAGKPAKPKYSPYSKPAKGPAITTPVKPSVGKDLCQPLPAQIMPAHLAAVAAAMSNAFSLRPAHHLPASHGHHLPTGHAHHLTMGHAHHLTTGHAHHLTTGHAHHLTTGHVHHLTTGHAHHLTAGHAPRPALFQSLPPALLRPAPGPVRTHHPQVLFAPY